MSSKEVLLVIPSYEPDERLLELIDSVKKASIDSIIVINDGSSDNYDTIFDKVKSKGVKVIKHSTNRGKGAALKTAFTYIIDNYPSTIGCVTADSDGQHSTIDIVRMIHYIEYNPDKLILGCRNFDSANVPFKSKKGNKITRSVLKTFCGLNISDTQTGLRAIPLSFMKECLNIKGDRFEFETDMLLLTKETHTDIIEINIDTIYDSVENHSTHFNPIVDSYKIYKVILGHFFRYIFVGVSSAILELTLFYVVFSILDSSLKEIDYKTSLYITITLTRALSSIYNYVMNYKFTFKSRESGIVTFIKYYMLVMFNYLVSMVALPSLCMILNKRVHPIIVKVVLDTLLMILSYIIQKKVIFKYRSIDN